MYLYILNKTLNESGRNAVCLTGQGLCRLVFTSSSFLTTCPFSSFSDEVISQMRSFCLSSTSLKTRQPAVCRQQPSERQNEQVTTVPGTPYLSGHVRTASPQACLHSKSLGLLKETLLEVLLILLITHVLSFSIHFNLPSFFFTLNHHQF